MSVEVCDERFHMSRKQEIKGDAVDAKARSGSQPSIRYCYILLPLQVPKYLL